MLPILGFVRDAKFLLPILPLEILDGDHQASPQRLLHILDTGTRRRITPALA